MRQLFGGWFWILSLVMLGSIDGLIRSEPLPAFTHITADSVVLEIYECYDTFGILDGFRTHIITPVCEDRLCHDVDVEFYWDVLGNFSHFTSDEEYPLTKQDHIPFSEEDYAKLLDILRTPSPAFIHLRRTELIAEPLNHDDVDGLTGATAHAVKKDMVPGAIYTCYTLWHIAHGAIHFKILEHTRSKLDAPLIDKMFSIADAEAHYFLLDHLAPVQIKNYLKRFTPLAATYEAYFLTRLMGRMPNDMLEKAEVDLLIPLFSKMENSVKNRLLHIISENPKVKAADAHQLLRELPLGSVEMDDKIIKLLLAKSGTKDVGILEEMYDHIFEDRIKMGKEVTEILKSLDKTYPQLKQKTKRYRRSQIPKK